MRPFNPLQDRMKRREYPAERRTRSTSGYHHVHDPVGRTWSIFVQLIGEELAGESEDHLFHRKFAAIGVTEENIGFESQRRCPAYGDYYLQKTGVTLTAHIAYDRWHKSVVYSNGETGRGGKGARSPLHYTNNALLRVVFPKVQFAYKSGLILTLDQMAALGNI